MKKDVEITDRLTHIPQTEAYRVGECCRDLLDFAAKLLVLGKQKRVLQRL